jgi:nucleotide-binding universal stress UspA family protein
VAALANGGSPRPGDRVVVPMRAPHAVDRGALRVAAAVARRGDLAVEVVNVATVDIRSYALWSGASLLCARQTGHHLGLRASLPPLLGAVPVLAVGPRFDPAWTDCGRLVVAVDGTRSANQVVDTAARLGHRIDAELELVEVLAPGEEGAEALDVPETAFLHCVARRVVPPPDSFDILHDRRAADGILRFVGRDLSTVIVLGCGRVRRLHHRVRAAVMRRAPCPVLLVPS